MSTHGSRGMRWREAGWDNRVNHASRGNNRIHTSFRHYFTPDVYESMYSNKRSGQRAHRQDRFSDPYREQGWNNRTAVCASKNNKNVHDCQREYFDCPRVLHRDGSSTARFPSEKHVPLMPMPQYFLEDGVLPGTHSDIHSIRQYIEGGNPKLFSWNSKPDEAQHYSATPRPGTGGARAPSSRPATTGGIRRRREQLRAQSRASRRQGWNSSFAFARSTTSFRPRRELDIEDYSWGEK